MINLCLNCEIRVTRNHNVLCHKCGLEERAKQNDNIYIRNSRLFKMDARELVQELPGVLALRDRSRGGV